MKKRSVNNMGSGMAWSRFCMAMKSVLLSAFILAGLQGAVQAQETQFTRPSLWFGVAAGANYSFYGGSTQQLNSDLNLPVAFHKGNGPGLYLAPLIEFHPPASVLGVMLQAGYDSRGGSFNEVITPDNYLSNLTTNLSYFTLEPSLRIAPFKSNFYLYGGPRVAFNLEKAFTYKLGINPDFPKQEAIPDVKGDLSHIKNTLVSMQIGAGYDIQLSSQHMRAQFVLSPFVSFQPYFGQSPRSIETWTITNLRAGAALKFGIGSEIQAPEEVEGFGSRIRFTVNAPKNIPSERRVREIFPLRNYVFFDLGSTEIPDRYELLSNDQVKYFKEDQLEMYTPKNLLGRSHRQMTVYYNILNILGDRMGRAPSTSILLVGSSEKGPEDGRAMSESIKKYLVEVFGIDASRITTEGGYKPEIPSEQPGGTLELDLLREGDRRVSIESNSPALLMEFQSGAGAQLRPVEIIALQEAPIDSYVTFQVEGERDAFSPWQLIITDKEGQEQYFGPYIHNKVSIPGKAILGTRPKGTYMVTMVGQAANGDMVKRITFVHMVRWTPPKGEELMRFSVIYEFDESKTTAIYEKYLTEVVIPNIPKGGKVIVHGYTDIIGDEAYNQTLSLARAEDVRRIMKEGLAEAGRSDVAFDVYGFGEDQKLAPFDNEFPEERAYNRAVVIDILKKK
ncbi:MAG: OmpA family protein [Saprospirales bacterium]|nr:OmpA family protein [Saprospirales bacterium]